MCRREGALALRWYAYEMCMQFGDASEVMRNHFYQVLGRLTSQALLFLPTATQLCITRAEVKGCGAGVTPGLPYFTRKQREHL